MQADLAGKTAIVTGGAGRTSIAISTELARRGADVVVAQRSRTNVDELHSRIEDIGPRCASIETDLADDNDIVALVEATHERFRRPHVVVSNAVDPAKDPAESMSREYIDRTLGVNLVAPFRLAQEA